MLCESHSYTFIVFGIGIENKLPMKDRNMVDRITVNEKINASVKKFFLVIFSITLSIRIGIINVMKFIPRTVPSIVSSIMHTTNTEKINSI